jgi:predicted acyl esterase
LLITHSPFQDKRWRSRARYQLIVNADILRGRYWKGFARATPVPANTVTSFTVDLHGQLYRFRKGHRLMVQIQSALP